VLSAGDVATKKVRRSQLPDVVVTDRAVPGLAAVVSTAALNAKADAIKRFLAATGESIVLARSEPVAAASAIKAAWSGGPSDNVIREQVEATNRTLESPKGKPVGWVDGKMIEDALQLIGSVENIGKPKPIYLKDPKGYWTGTVLEPYGLVYHPKVLARLIQFVAEALR
jgi:ABC-type nitrate/sulfonate/bicarbonate transport system substrate-binding protein